jgi:hypothetical protein
VLNERSLVVWTHQYANADVQILPAADVAYNLIIRLVMNETDKLADDNTLLLVRTIRSSPTHLVTLHHDFQLEGEQNTSNEPAKCTGEKDQKQNRKYARDGFISTNHKNTTRHNGEKSQYEAKPCITIARLSDMSKGHDMDVARHFI